LRKKKKYAIMQVMIIERNDLVTASRVGSDGKLTQVAALDMIQDTDCIGAESDESLNQFLEENDMAMFIVSRQVKFFDLPSYRESVCLRTMPYLCNAHFGYRYTELSSGGRLCAYSHTIAVYVNLTSGRPGRINKELAEDIETHEPLNAPLGERRVIVNTSFENSCCELTISPRDIDVNNHVNNIRYIEKAISILPEDFIVSGLRVEYKTSAKLGDTLFAERRGSSTVQYITLSDINGKAYSVMEFTSEK